MDWQNAFNIAVTVANAGWALVFKLVYGEISRLRHDHNTTKQTLANTRETYVSKPDLNERLQDIKEMLQRIERKIDDKQDKK